jgi:hypothetical protein
VAKINPSVPAAGRSSGSEDPKTKNALSQIIALLCGNQDRGSLDAANMNPAFAKDNVEPALGNWQTIARGAGLLQGMTAGTRWVLQGRQGLVVPIKDHQSGGGADVGDAFLPTFRVPPAPRAEYMRVRATLITNSTAPNVNFVVSASHIAYAFFSSSVWLDAVDPAVADSSNLGVAFNAPAAGASLVAVGTELPAGAFVAWAFTLAVSGTQAASSQALVMAELQTKIV